MACKSELVIMKFLAFSIFTLTLAITSCNINVGNSHKKFDVASEVKCMAQVECKAIQLREQRFALADDIRFTQEKIMQLKGKGDTTQLSNKLSQLYKRKEVLLTASLQLADQIKHRLDSIMTTELNSPKERSEFSIQLNNAMEQTCACNKVETTSSGSAKSSSSL